MYLDGFSFLEDERDAWRPYEALLELSDEQLSMPVDAAHGWSGRDLIAHLIGWHEVTLLIAKELAVGPKSPLLERYRVMTDPEVDEINARWAEEWRALPMSEVRRRFETVPGELRGYLTVVPESRWLKDEHGYQWMLWNTLDHYAGHEPDLTAVLEAARAASA